MADAEADDTDHPVSPPGPGLGFSSPAPHLHAAMIAARGELQPVAPGEEGTNGAPADHVAFATPPSSPSLPIALASSPQAAVPGLGRRLLGAIGLSSPYKPPPPGAGVIRRPEMGLGLVLHLKDKDKLKGGGDQEEEGAAHHGDCDTKLVLAPAPAPAPINTHALPSPASSFTGGFGDQDDPTVHDSLHIATTHDDTACAVLDHEEEEDMVHKCSDANSHEAPALEGEFTVAVGDIISSAERGCSATSLQDTDAKVQRLLDQDSSDQCKQTAEDIHHVGEELVLEQGLGDPTDNVLAVEHWEILLNHHKCAANGNDIALESLGKVTEQCTSGELGATMDDSAVEDQVMMVQPEGVINKQGATKDDATVEDLEKVVEQCTRSEVGEIMDANVVKDQELVEPKGVVGDKEKAMEQCAGGKSTTTNHGNALEEKEKVVELEGRLDRQGTIKDGNALEYQVEEVVEQGVVSEQIAIRDNISGDGQEKVVQQCTSDDSRSTMDDDAVGDHEVVEHDVVDERGETTGDIAIKYQEKAPEQCTSDELGGTVDDNAVRNQEVVEQEVIDKRAETTGDIVIKYQEKALEQCTSDELGGKVDDNTVEDQEVVEQDVIIRRAEATGDIAVEDQEMAPEQCTSDQPGGTLDDIVVGDQELVEQVVIDKRSETIEGISVEDQAKAVEQCATNELGSTENDDVVEDQVAEGVITESGETTGAIAVEDQGKAVEQCTTDELGVTWIDDTVEGQEVGVRGVNSKTGGMMDDNAVEDQEKVVEQHAVNESRASKDDNAVEGKEKVLEQSVIDKQGAMPMDDIAAKDQEKAVEQYFGDELIINNDAVVGHKKVAEQGIIDASSGTKDDIGVEEQENVKEQGITDKWDTTNDGTALEYQKKAAELCTGDEQRAIKDVAAVHNQENMWEQSISDERGATKGEFTVEKHKKVVEHVRHERGATEDDLAVNTAASGGVIGILSPEVDSINVNSSDGETLKEKVKLCVGYPQRPGKLNCPFYMSTGCCSYGLSCHFNHPMLKAKSDVSSVPSEQGNHGAIEILELNRVGLPIREGARNCTYYMRNGTCGYGKKCHYNHPDHAQFDPPTGWEDNTLPSSPHLKRYSDHDLDGTSYLKKSSDGVTLDDTSYSKKSSGHATLDGTSYSKKSFDHANIDDTSSSLQVLPPNILRMLLPPQKIPPSTEEKTIKVKKDPDWSSVSDNSDGCCSADSSDGPLCKQEHVDYPERPGRLECLRFGDCKFASACKHHHSKDKFPSRYNSKDPSLGEELMEYPERPGEPECPFYMKSRFCKFGAECKFHHSKDLTPSRWSPATTKKSVAAANEHHPATRIAVKDHICQQQQYPERPGQPNCRYYMQFGKCKFLSACIFHHPKDRLSSEWHPSDQSHSDQHDTWQPTSRKENLRQQVQIWPEIPGTPECPFYMKTGTCQFGSACEFRHPKDRCSTTEEAIGQGTDLAYDSFIRPENVLQQQEQTMYPERPGEPECSYYMRHGCCKFQMNCKFHHPRYRSSKNPYGSSSYS